MGVPGAIQVRLRAPRPGATVESWSLPAFAAPMRSASVMMGVGDDLVLIRQRVAGALGIQSGDLVDFTFEEVEETFQLQVKINDKISSDVLIHDFLSLGLAESITMGSGGTTVELTSSRRRELLIAEQEMWAGMRIVEKKGSARLFFDGASRNNPHGPAGYGFHIVLGGLDGFGAGAADELVRGYGYAGMNRSSNEMEYEGLIEGLIWATRLDLLSLTICGDSELILRQVSGEYSVRNHRLQALLAKVKTLLKKDSNLEWKLHHIPREENTICDGLANRAIDTRENVTTCNWQNINRLMKVSRMPF